MNLPHLHPKFASILNNEKNTGIFQYFLKFLYIMNNTRLLLYFLEDWSRRYISIRKTTFNLCWLLSIKTKTILLLFRFRIHIFL